MKTLTLAFLGLFVVARLAGQELDPQHQDADRLIQPRRDLTRFALPAGDECLAGNIACGGTISGAFSSADCTWFGISAGEAYFSAVDPYSFQGTSGTTITVTYSSQDIPAGDLLLIISTPPDATGNYTSLARRWGAGTLTYTLPNTGQYWVNASSRNSVSGRYALSLACSTSTGNPNLAPVWPTGWSDRIVVSTTTGTHTDSPVLTSADILYVDYAVGNLGPGTTQARFVNELYVDGILRRSAGADPPLAPNFSVGPDDFNIGTLSVGTHTLRLKADATNVISETNETDNEYTKTITVTQPGGLGICTPTATNLCLNAARFRVSVTWRVPSQGTSGIGTGVGISNDTGYFWFFTNTNLELVVKILDGRAINGRFWVSYGALSDVEYTITVTDTITGASRTYTNPQGQLASVADTAAF